MGKRATHLVVRALTALDVHEDHGQPAFEAAAKSQLICAACGTKRGAWHPHHVLYQQHLRREKLPRYHVANALRLCVGCHADHHSAAAKLKVQRLETRNIDFVLHALGLERGAAYLRRYYDDAGEDSRLARAVDLAGLPAGGADADPTA
jgi:hypothetical protein